VQGVGCGQWQRKQKARPEADSTRDWPPSVDCAQCTSATSPGAGGVPLLARLVGVFEFVVVRAHVLRLEKVTDARARLCL